MLEYLRNLHPLGQALIATGFTWAVTALGAATVFLFKNMSRRVLDAMLGFAAGIMIAASFWSLLAPSIELSKGHGIASWVPPAVGFILGGVFLRICDMLLPHLHLNLPISRAEGIKTGWQKTILLVLAITLHNIPEGLAVGVAFGAVAVQLEHSSYTLASAIALTIGIGLQNFPEGLAVSVPLRREGLSRWKSFWYGQLSGVVEPIAGAIGAVTVVYAAAILPYALSFAAGAMIFVVVEEAIPESQQGGNSDLATLGTMAGFTVMMILDVGLG